MSMLNSTSPKTVPADYYKNYQFTLTHDFLFNKLLIHKGTHSCISSLSTATFTQESLRRDSVASPSNKSNKESCNISKANHFISE